MSTVAVTLDDVLRTLTREQKLQRLARLYPSDAAAIELIIDDCLQRRWPTAHTWLVVPPRSPEA